MSDATRLSVTDPAGYLPAARARDVAGWTRETGAWGHWIFGPTATDLTDSVNSRTLTPMSYTLGGGRGFVTLKHRPFFGLQSALADATAGTFCAVFKVDALPEVGLRTEIGGSLNTTAGNGASLMVNSTPALQFYGDTSGPNYTHNFHSGVDVSGAWRFVGVSKNFGASPPVVICYLGGVGAQTHEYTGVTYETGDNFSWGSDTNALSAIGAPSLHLAEGILFETVKSASELGEIYARSKARLALYGISVV